VRITGNTLAHLNIFLNDYRVSDLPEELLNGLQTNFDDIREAGIKAIIRFAYNEGPYPDTEPDASKQQILRHIEQLTPLLQKNADVIAWVEAGFIGAWGEWHTSTNGLDNIQDKQEILTALVAAIPDRYVQVRYPANIIEMYPDPMDAVEARVAHHNDCFLSSNTDVGTYERDGEITIERDQAYLAELTRFTPMSGETCAPFPPRSECTNAIQEMELLHFSAINEAYHKGILRSWKDGGCLQEITDRMGYRLSLTSADFNEKVRPGGLLHLTVNITNSGFASLMNPRPLFVVLQEPNSIFLTKLELDPRTWEPGDSSFTASIRLPSKMGEGDYKLALWLPDGSETLQANPLYAVQLANEGVWDESTGYNILGKVTVDSSTTGSYQSADFMQAEELSTETTVLMATSMPVSTATVPMPTSTPNPTSTPEPASSSSDNALISNVEILNHDTFLTIKFDFVGKTADYNGFQIFLDVDQNLSTGYSINGVGADFLLENGTLNSYSGAGSDWSWTDAKESVLFDNADNVAQWLFDTSKIGKPSSLDFVCQLVDTNWNTVFTTQKISFTFK
jgi:hypothetical protein